MKLLPAGALALALSALLAAACAAPAPSADALRVPSNTILTEERARRLAIIRWQPHPDDPKRSFYIQLPQLKLFDADGRLVFHGSAIEALRWGRQATRASPAVIDAAIQVRDWRTEARLLGLPEASAGPRAVFYVSDPCPPCVTQLAELRRELLPRFGADAGLNVVRVGAGAGLPR